MDKYSRIILENGLTVLLLQDTSTRMASVAVLYKVGSRDENENKTGLAHLFEHLMFSNCGKDIDFDEIMQNAGGDSNAFTNPDTTQYYNIAPAHHLELMLALEAKRMDGFKISKKDFNTQQKVVIEEFSEHYLNNPYGMFSHQLMAMAYDEHPYRWPVIGVNQEALNSLRFEDAENFYTQYYHPANAILTVNGNFEKEECLSLIKKHFGHIPPGNKNTNCYIQESNHKKNKRIEYTLDIPEEAIYIAFPAAARTTTDFYALDFLTDILSEGKSSKLYSKLRKEKMIFSTIDCYLTATFDPGLIIVEGKLNNNISMQQAENEIWEVLEELKRNPIDEHEWEKYMNKNESAYLFSQVGVVNQALNLSYSEWLGNPDLIYNELEYYKNLNKKQIQDAAIKYLNPNNANYLYYYRKSTNSQ